MSVATKNAWQEHCRELAQWALVNLVNRSDRHGCYSPDGAYTANELDEYTLQNHFHGAKIVGVHSTSEDATCRWLGLDIDNHDGDDNLSESNFSEALSILNRLTELGIAAILEDSNGDGGYHIWILFDSPAPTAEVYRFGKWLVGDEHETFPKQAALSGKGLGNWLRLPGRHHTRDHWSRFWGDGEWLDESESVELLLNAPHNPPTVLECVPEETPSDSATAPLPPAQRTIRTGLSGSIVDVAEREIEAEPWANLLRDQGWKLNSESGAESTWTRPGKDHGVSATLNHGGNNLLHVFSTAAPIPADGPNNGQSFGKWRFWLWSNGFDDRQQIDAAKQFLGPEVVAQHDQLWRESRGLNSPPAVDASKVTVCGQISVPDSDTDIDTHDTSPEAGPRLIGGTLHCTLEQLEKLASLETSVDDEGTQAYEPLPRSVFDTAPGFLGQYYRYLLRHADVPAPELFLSAGLAVLATVTGRKYCMPFQQWNTRSNLFLFCLAPSGIGKEFAREVNGKAIRAVEGILPGMLGAEEFASDTAMLKSLRDFPCQLWQFDEFSKLIESVNDSRSGAHLRQIPKALMRVFTSSNNPVFSGKGYADTKETFTIDRPHAVIFGTSTPVDFWRRITVEQVQDGLVGRMLSFEDKRALPKPPAAPVIDTDGCVVPTAATQTELPEDLLFTLKDWMHRDGDNIELRIKADAYDRMATHRSEIIRRQMSEDEMRAAIWGRASEKTSKLTMLSAMSRGSLTVELADVEWAVLAVNALTRRIIRRITGSVSENQFEANTKKLLATIENAGAIIRSDLTRRTQWTGGGRFRESILSDLIEGEQIVSVRCTRKSNVGHWYGVSYKAVLGAMKRRQPVG